METNKRIDRSVLLGSVGTVVVLFADALGLVTWLNQDSERPPRVSMQAHLSLSEADERTPQTWKEVADTLKTAKSLTVYSLAPDPLVGNEMISKELEGKSSFNSYLILSAAQVKSQAVIKDVVEKLIRGVSTNQDRAMCFFPRHGIRAPLEDGRWIDLVICYQCSQIEVSGAKGSATVHTSDISREPLDRVLSPR